MSDATGHSTPTGKIIDFGEPLIKLEKDIETVAECYYGRLVAKGTSDGLIKVADGVNGVPIGWLLFEQTSEEWAPDAYTTLPTVLDTVKVGRGGDFSIYAWVPKGFVTRQGDYAISFTNGYVVPGTVLNGCPAIALPFSKNASEFDTSVDLPSGLMIIDCRVLVETGVASGYIDVGLLSTESSGTANGFVDGEACVNTGMAIHVNGSTADSSNTFGSYLSTLLKDNTATPLFWRVGKMGGYQCNGTNKSVSYTTYNGTLAGRFFLLTANPGSMVVGRFEESADFTAAEGRAWVLSTL